jgi:hypothetical protein
LQAQNHRFQKGVEFTKLLRYPIRPIQADPDNKPCILNNLRTVPSQNLFEEGLLFFNSGSYYQAHESWEDLWRVTQGPVRVFYQGLIQAAVGLHHLCRGNEAGARGQIAKSIGHLTNFQDNPHFVDTIGLIKQLREIGDDLRPRPVRIARIK